MSMFREKLRPQSGTQYSEPDDSATCDAHNRAAQVCTKTAAEEFWKSGAFSSLRDLDVRTSTCEYLDVRPQSKGFLESFHHVYACRAHPQVDQMSRRRPAAAVCSNWRRASCLSAVLLFLLIGVGRTEASQADGTWIIQNLILHIFDCQQLVCGRIVWIKDPAKRQSQCGRIIIWGLAAAAQNEWTGGAILDPNDGKTYQLAATYEPDGTLHARIFKGTPLFGKTEILTRVDVRNFIGQC